MSAWDKLLAASSLALGTAWQLISSPRTGGSGLLVYIEQIQSTMVADEAVSVLADDTITSATPDDTITSTVTVVDAASLLPDNTIQVTTS